eukprot:9474986-Pyramimonas_sp.AAC.1
MQKGQTGGEEEEEEHDDDIDYTVAAFAMCGLTWSRQACVITWSSLLPTTPKLPLLSPVRLSHVYVKSDMNS